MPDKKITYGSRQVAIDTDRNWYGPVRRAYKAGKLRWFRGWRRDRTIQRWRNRETGRELKARPSRKRLEQHPDRYEKLGEEKLASACLLGAKHWFLNNGDDYFPTLTEGDIYLADAICDFVEANPDRHLSTMLSEKIKAYRSSKAMKKKYLAKYLIIGFNDSYAKQDDILTVLEMAEERWKRDQHPCHHSIVDEELEKADA